jgi:TonB family protein
MKTLVCLSLAVAGTIAAAAPAQEGRDVVVVAKPITLAQWTAGVGSQIDKVLRYPTDIMNENMSGIASVRFQCSDDGKPTAMTVSRKSGWRDLDREAVRAVAKLKTMHPLPDGLKHDQHYVANILFARSQDDHDRQIAKWRKEADRRNAWFRSPDQAIVINVGSQARVRRTS